MRQRGLTSVLSFPCFFLKIFSLLKIFANSSHAILEINYSTFLHNIQYSGGNYSMLVIEVFSAFFSFNLPYYKKIIYQCNIADFYLQFHVEILQIIPTIILKYSQGFKVEKRILLDFMHYLLFRTPIINLCVLSKKKSLPYICERIIFCWP